MRKIYSVLVLLVTVMMFGSKAYSQISVTATGGTLGPTIYTTLNGAINAINAGTHTGTVNVTVTASTTETVQSSLNSNGTGAASYSSILIKPGTGVTASIATSSIGSTQAILKLNGADNVTIDGSNTVGGTTRNLSFTSTAAGAEIWLCAATSADGATNNTVKNCILTGGGPAAGTAAIYSGGTAISTAALSLTNNTGNTFQNNSISAHLNGLATISSSGFPYDANLNITGNTLTNIAIKGIFVQGSSSFTISNNVLNGIGAGFNVTGAAGSLVPPVNAMYIGYALSGGNVFNNVINTPTNGAANWGAAGIYLGGGTASNVTIYNNTIYNATAFSGSTTTADQNGYGISVGTGSGYNIYFNSIYQNQAGSGMASAAVFVSSGIVTTSAIDLRNNVLINTQASGVATRTAIFCNNASSVFSFIDNNDYYSASGILGSLAGSPKTSIAAMQSSFGGNTASVSILPSFVGAPSNLRLQNVVGNELLQGGVSISGITTDVDGNLRATVPVMGISEVHVPPVIAYTAVAPSCGTSDIILSGVTITDAIGVPTTGTLVPRIYFKKNSGAYSSAAGTLTSGSGTSGTWSFTIPATTVGGLTAGDNVSYYIVAQNTVNTLVANPSAGFSGTDVNTITSPPTSPNTFTVSALPTVASITPVAPSTCIGTSLTLNAGVVSGTGTLTSYNWSGPNGYSTTTTTSSTSFIPTTTAASGFYSLTVTYQGSGCTSTVRSAAVTVNPAPPAITGTMAVCSGSTTTLHNTTTGGTWSSSNTSVGTVGSTTGIVAGIAGGTTTVSYTVGGVCVVTTVVTVNQTPFGITGTSAVCVGSVTTLANSLSGGTWISNNPSVASVTSTGDVSGVSAGLATVTYTITSTGCYTSRLVTVNALPSLISGINTVCVGSTTTLGSTPNGGVWSSSNSSIASTPGTGVITGVAIGTANITYTLGTGCQRTIVVTVNQTPSAITGPTSVCSGTTVTLNSTPAGGNWTPNTSAIAFVNSTTGVVTGVSTGNSLISYTLPNGCRATYTVTGLASPPAIGGTLALCQGATTTLNNGVAGGTWSSTNIGVATIGIGTGFVNAIAAGTATISYITSSGCYRTAVFTVNALPAATTGVLSVCAGLTTTLSNSTGTGTWSSGNPGVATIGVSTGVLMGVAAGTANITYKLSTGCLTVDVATVNALPAAIAGTGIVCQGATTILTETTGGGAWSTQNPAIATVDAAGVVTGTATGTTVQSTNITYTVPTGCFRTKAVTVNPIPAAITGTTGLCVGTSATLADATAGGTWSTSNGAVATINVSTGLWNAVAAGNATITYRLATGCLTTTAVSANPLPGAITGTASMCLGATTTLSNSVTGGVWTSFNAAVATISSAGVVTGNAVGTAVISYTLSTGCARGIVVSVNPLPSALSGTPVVCEASTTNFTATPGGGTWSTSNTTVATAGAISGVITGVSAGIVTISYSIGTGCFSTTTVTVNPRPAPITGANNVCVGGTTPLSTLSTTGTWSSSNLTIATISATGVVTGVAQGGVTISYTLPTGCARTFSLIVNPLPSVITGPSSVCQGLNIGLVSGGGGTWSSSDVTIATVGTNTGIVTGVTVGTATISFIVGTGCYRTHDVTVNTTPTPITGSLTVCSGSTTALSSSPAGGVWSPTSSAIASVNSSTGVVLGISPGAQNISYTLGTGCRATALVSVYVTPGAIGGTTSICEGTVTTLSNSQPGGTWSSGNIVVASITTNTGVLTGINQGTAVITYTGATGGCFSTITVTVNPLPLPITGVQNVCVGAATTYADATPGGIWSTSSAAIAPVGPTNGIVSGFSAGNATITYKLSTGCYVTSGVTVDPTPGAIAGVSSACLGSTSLLSDASAGGTWSSSNPGTANVDVTGVVTGITSGTATITYTLSTSCFNTRVFTVYPVPATIGGVQVVCAGMTTTLNDGVPGGVWTSGDLSIATIGSLTGIVTGGAAGTAPITYRLSTGCFTTTDVTVNAAPAPITGTPVSCVGGTTALGELSSGNWSSSNNTVATVDAITGVVTGVAAGTAIITFTSTTNGCLAVKTFTVQALPSAISGVPTVCTGLTTTLASTPGGGTWTSSNSGVATVSATGIVTGVSGGIATISYTLSTGCGRTTDVTVNVTPPAITGNTAICIGATGTLSNAITGGTWISSNTSVASVGYSTGIVNGLAAGLSTITYTLTSGCKATSLVTVQGLPAAITGTAVVCEGGTTTLTDATPGGLWTSSNTAVATIGTGSGIVVGLGAGTTNITYTVITSGCQRVRILTVNPLPAAISGVFSACVGSTTALSSATLGGSWTSANTAIANVNVGTGVVTGVSNGTVTITYTLATGCNTTQIVTINPLPTTITGVASLCTGSTTVLSNSTGGGTWSSSNTVIATVDVTTGVVTGVSQGNALITYTLGTTGCRTTRAVTVNPLPAAIMGTLSVCEGLTTNLSDLTPGGTWSSSIPFVATVGPSGIVTGATAGITTIAYTLVSTGCRATADVTVNPQPYAISGTTNICIGLTAPLSSLSTGGTWSSSNTLIATVDATSGLLTGVAVGTARITYMISTGCRTFTVVTVSPQPASIAGVTTVCQGQTTTLSSSTVGGNWVTSDFSIASVSSTGVVTGIAPGVANISYVLPTGCMRSVTVTVNVAPVAIAGTTTICRGNTTTLTDASPGGNWSSSNTTVATISVSGGLLTAVNPGTSLITYSLATGCKTFAVVSVSPLPAMITGATLLCEGSTSALANAVAGGTWSSTFDFIATVDVSTGLASGVSSGIDTIKYTLPGGCATSIVITVNPAPPSITGDSNICVGFISHLANATSGGTWSSSNPSVATVGLGNGILTGISAGTAYITYTLGAGCKVVGSITVNPQPAPILGPNVVCSGLAITLTNSVAGGTWTSDDASVASVVSVSGVVTGVTSGVDTIRYTLAGGCSSSFGVTVNPTPVPISNQPLNVCQGLTLTLSDISAGGIWTSSDAAIAPITPTPSSNMVLGVAPGTVTISYVFPATGCATSATLTVNTSPAPITGNMTVCEGSTSLLSTTSIGGTWSSSAPAVASVGSNTGIVIGFSAGLATITYTLPTSCIITALVVINPSPAAIAGATTICVGSATTFTDATAFGTWSSSNTSVASVNSATGVVGGVTAGTATITYKLASTGCYVTQQVTINPLPPPVLGNPFVCVGAYTTLTNIAAPGGTWSSSNPSVGTVDPTGGNVTGIAAGTTIVTYTQLTACYVSTIVTVEALPAPIAGTANVCENAMLTLTDAYPGGVWTSSNDATATVGSTGVVTGHVAGPVTITYATPVAHCAVTTTFSVNPVPVAILGANNLCEGTSTTYFDGTPGGTWTSNNITIATIGGSTGVLTAVAPDTVTISYTIASGCFASKLVTVDPLSHAGTIVGPPELCENTTVTYINPTAIPVTGGTWSSSNVAAATVDAATGAVTGVAVGTTILTYIAANTCSADTATFALTVNPQPHAGVVSGILSLCKDYTSTLTSTVSGGVWTSGNTAVATVSATGVVSAVTSGTSVITYAYTNSCGTDITTVVVTVNLVAPHTAISIHPDSVVCLNTMNQNFGTDSAAPSGLVYTWTVVNAELYATSGGGKNSIVNFPYTGVATIKLVTQIASTGCFVTDSFNVTVGADSARNPEVKYYANELICTDNTADTYVWGYDDKATLDSNLLMAPGFNQQAVYLPVPDFTGKSYWVISSHGGCFQKTYYNPPTNVITVSTDFDIHIFPNPADAIVNIEVSGGNLSDNITATVIDMLGKEIATAKLVNGKCGFNVFNMPAGVYSVMFVADGAKIGARTFVKQ